MIKAYIFDLNGVLVISEHLSTRFARDFGVSEQGFLMALKEIMCHTRRPGAAAVFSYWEPYFKKWGINFTAQDFQDYWFNSEHENAEMTAWARELKKQGYKIFFLSNNLRERSHYYENNFAFMKELPDKIYYSWQTGFVKPDPNAWELVLKDNDLKAEECVYIDNTEENLAVAVSLGFKAMHPRDC